MIVINKSISQQLELLEKGGFNTVSYGFILSLLKSNSLIC